MIGKILFIWFVLDALLLLCGTGKGILNWILDKLGW